MWRNAVASSTSCDSGRCRTGALDRPGIGGIFPFKCKRGRPGADTPRPPPIPPPVEVCGQSSAQSARSCRECCGNSLAARSEHLKVRFFRLRGQGASVR